MTMHDPTDEPSPDTGAMVVAIAVFALIGGLITVVLLWPHGALVALVGAPFGGSFTALVVAFLLAWRRDHYMAPDKPQSRARSYSRDRIIVK